MKLKVSCQKTKNGFSLDYHLGETKLLSLEFLTPEMAIAFRELLNNLSSLQQKVEVLGKIAKHENPSQSAMDWLDKRLTEIFKPKKKAKKKTKKKKPSEQELLALFKGQ